MISQKTIDEMVRMAQYHEANADICVTEDGHVISAMRYEYQYNLAEARKYRKCAADLAKYNETSKRISEGELVMGCMICQS